MEVCGELPDDSCGRCDRINNNSHTIIVTKVYSGSIQYADCNSTGDCQIQWGKTMSRPGIEKSFFYMYTKY